MFFNAGVFFHFSEECAFEDEEIVSVTSVILLFSSKTLDPASVGDSDFFDPSELHALQFSRITSDRFVEQSIFSLMLQVGNLRYEDLKRWRPRG